jgi:hypothetical protein
VVYVIKSPRGLSPSTEHAEALRVTSRAWKILALGAVAIAGLGGFAVAGGHSSPSTKPAANWGLYSSEQWQTITTSFARRGFPRNSVRVVTGTTLATGQSFALIGGRSNAGHTCFAVARGVTLGRTICGISKPLTVFYATDTCYACSPGGPPTRIHTILALIRGDVTVTMISQGRESGLGVIPAGTGFALNSSFLRSDRLRARDASGRVLATVSPPA